MKKSVIVVGCMLPSVALAMADRTAPVYGRPTLYGEYETTAGDRRRASVLYGAVPPVVGEKMPVKHKKPMPKNIAKKKKQNRAVLKKEAAPKKSPLSPADDIIVVPAREVPDAHVADAVTAPEKKEVRPAPTAVTIATANASDVAPSIESFCTQRRRRHRGALPDGYVLMPGRPDLMSCSDK